MAVSVLRREEGVRAIERAKARLKIGDRIRVRRCGGISATYTLAGWDGCWMVSKSGISDLFPLHVTRVNGQPVTFRDTICVRGRWYFKFIPRADEVTDGTIRCAQCGQIDEPEVHDDALCKLAQTPA